MSRKIKLLILIGALLAGGVTLFFLLRRNAHPANAHISLIPTNAAAVLKIDLPRLIKQADMTSLLELVKEKNAADDRWQGLAAAPMESGIDFESNIYGFLTKKDEHIASGLVIGLNDADKFSDLIASLAFTQKPYKENELWFASLDQRHALAWNNVGAIYLSMDDGNAESEIRSYFGLKENESLKANKEFGLFNEKEADVSLFLDNRAMAQMNNINGMLSPFGVNSGFGTILLRFGDDMITADYSSTSQVSNDLLRKSGPAAKHFECLSKKDPLIYVQFAANMNAVIKSMNTEEGYADFIANLEDQLNVSQQKLNQLFSGDISISFSDYQVIDDYDPRIKEMKAAQSDHSILPSNTGLAQPLTTLSFGETDDALTEQLLVYAGMQKEKNFYKMPGYDFIIYGAVTDGHLIITNDYYAADELSSQHQLNGKLSGTHRTVAEAHPFFACAELDQKKFPALFLDALREDYGKDQTDLLLRFMQVFSSVSISSDGTGSHLELLLAHGKGNGLSRIITTLTSTK